MSIASLLPSKYLIRLDDACPTMDKKKWHQIEEILSIYNIKPIVAVIPDNKNKKLIIDEYDSLFWRKVKEWKEKNWTIALHGYEHLYHTEKSGIVPINNRSEFAGLSYDEQVEKIRAAWEIFKEKGIDTKVWIAPAHSFDRNTLKALKDNTTIQYVSDGMAINTYYEDSFYWLPQQLWSFKTMPWGTWTICMHPNTMEEKDINDFDVMLKTQHKSFVSFNEISFKKRRRDILDILLEKFYFYKKNKT